MDGFYRERVSYLLAANLGDQAHHRSLEVWEGDIVGRGVRYERQQHG